MDGLKRGAAFASPEAMERIGVLLLCAVAAVHVCIFSAAFPFFSNVDEEYHFDMTLKYAQGHLPGYLETFSEESLPYIAIFGSPEYHKTPNDFPDGRFPAPVWTQPETNIAAAVMPKERLWKNFQNYESAQPPLYYSLTGLCWRLATAGGLHDGFLLYCLRFLNGLFVAALVWTGYAAARMVFPGRPFLRLGVPALIAFLPQSAFYSIQNDVLAPLCFGWLFLCVLHWLRTEIPGARLGILTGAAFTATAFAKMTNLPLLAVAAAAVSLKIGRLIRAGKLRAALPAVTALALCGGVPIGGWLLWTKLRFGDCTGAAMKAHFFGWTAKPFAEWWQHPIFTPRGFWTFLSGNLDTFWQGEMVWNGRPLDVPAVNWAYAIVSIALVLVTLLVVLPRFKTAAASERGALLFATAGVGATLAFFGLLSIFYDFHDCFYPSRGHPYFTSGRLLLGALIPFLLLFVRGFDRALARCGTPAKCLALAAWILFMIVSEIANDWPVFSSNYNWFQM